MSPLPSRNLDLLPAAMLESLDLAAYLARTDQPRQRRRALAIVAQAQRQAPDLDPAQRLSLSTLAEEVRQLSRGSVQRARNDRREQGRSLVAALFGGLGLLLLLELAWVMASPPQLPQTLVASQAKSGGGWVTFGVPGADPVAAKSSVQEAIPDPPPPPARQPDPQPDPDQAQAADNGLADPIVPASQPEPQPEPQVAEVEPEPQVAEVEPEPEAESLVDKISESAPEGSPEGAASNRGAGGGSGTGLVEISLPGGGWAAGKTALARVAPMTFHKIGPPPPDGGRDHGPLGLEVGRTEVTQAQWAALMDLDLGSISGHWDHPAEAMSWCGALRYANLLSSREHLRQAYRVARNCETGGTVRWDVEASGFRLLTEAEWLALAKVSGPPPTLPTQPDPASWSKYGSERANNRGVGGIDSARVDAEYELAGVADNVREWVWGADPSDTQPGAQSQRARWQARDGKRHRAVARGCGIFGDAHPTAEDPWCRASYGGDLEPLGVGLRLARGRLPEAAEAPQG